MIEAGEVLQEVQDAAAATAFKIPPRPCSRPFDVDDKAAAGAIAPFAPVTLGGLAQEAKCRLPQELGPVGVRGQGRVALGLEASQSSISASRQRTARTPTLSGRGNAPSPIWRYKVLLERPHRASTSLRRRRRLSEVVTVMLVPH